MKETYARETALDISVNELGVIQKYIYMIVVIEYIHFVIRERSRIEVRSLYIYIYIYINIYTRVHIYAVLTYTSVTVFLERLFSNTIDRIVTGTTA